MGENTIPLENEVGFSFVDRLNLNRNCFQVRVVDSDDSPEKSAPSTSQVTFIRTYYFNDFIFRSTNYMIKLQEKNFSRFIPTFFSQIYCNLRIFQAVSSTKSEDSSPEMVDLNLFQKSDIYETIDEIVRASTSKVSFLFFLFPSLFYFSSCCYHRYLSGCFSYLRVFIVVNWSVRCDVI